MMKTQGEGRAGFLSARVIHLHPSRFCNLACHHCYSTSGPDQRHALGPEAILATLGVLRQEGYTVLSLAGGEPLLYPAFEAVVSGAAELGFQINVVTNGAAVNGRRLAILAEYANLVAISLDGSPTLHNSVRGNARAFAYVEQALPRLVSAGIRTGLAYCITRESLADMPWAAEFAQSQQVALLQFHPFAATGRGRQLADRFQLDALDRMRAYLVAGLLQDDTGPQIQIDLAPVAALRARQADYQLLSAVDVQDLPLSHLVNPLIIDEQGRLMPFCYGIAEAWTLGTIGPDLPANLAHFRAATWNSVRTLLADAFSRLDDPALDDGLIDWFFHLSETSRLCGHIPRADQALGVLDARQGLYV